jgi:hypothetical protein
MIRSVFVRSNAIEVMFRYMKKEHYVSIGLLIFIAVFVTIPGCSVPAEPVGTGQLEGAVTIGPLCPVEPCHISDEQYAAAYATRHLVITDLGASSRIYLVSFSPDGHYRIQLPEGQYLVELPKNGIDRSPDVPKTVGIKRDQIVVLNVSIDTGIR